MTGADILIKYLILHQKLHLPDIGKFTVVHHSARLDFAEKKLHPPADIIMFTHENTSVDKHFYEFFAAEKGITVVEAIGRFNQLMSGIQSKLKQDNIAEIEGIGSLKKEYADTYTFKPGFSVSNYLPTLKAERFNRQSPRTEAFTQQTSGFSKDDEAGYETPAQSSESIEEAVDGEKNDWWIYALILFLLGVVALVWYYLQNGTFTV